MSDGNGRWNSGAEPRAGIDQSHLALHVGDQFRQIAANQKKTTSFGREFGKAPHGAFLLPLLT